MKIQTNALYQAEAISLLERIDSEVASLVYLDPPWFSTNGDLSRAARADSLKEYLLFISKIVQQTHRILSPTGCVFFQVEPSISSNYIRIVLDQVFGIDNFRAEFVWPCSRRQFARDLAPNHEVIFFYSKSDTFTYNPQFKAKEQEHFVSDQQGKYILHTLTSPVVRPALRFGWQGFMPPPKQSWKFSRERLELLLGEGKVDLSGKFPRLKVYQNETQGVEIGSFWDEISSIVPISERVVGNTLGQRPQALLDRIIRLASNVGDTVVDPFCGAGTSMASAHTNERKWIAGDISESCYIASRDRLEKLGLRASIDFFIGDESALRNKWNIIPFYYAPLVIPQEIAVNPLIITEGRTDWKHLKAAYTRLKMLEYWRDFDVEFREYEEDMGHDALEKLCQNLARVSHPRKIICIFDSNIKAIVSKFSDVENNKPFRSWGNNVYSLVLPVPKHRPDTDGVCIELYYKDDEIMRQDSNKRRLFLSTEFSKKSGRHSRNPLLIYRDSKRLEKSKLFIIDNDVLDKHDVNVALPKNDFANYVLRGDPNFNEFDISDFRAIFNVLVEIAMS
ncbi:MAG: site-specific DNA-methyltransferase [Pseudomonadota bacterium]